MYLRVLRMKLLAWWARYLVLQDSSRVVPHRYTIQPALRSLLDSCPWYLRSWPSPSSHSLVALAYAIFNARLFVRCHT